MSGRNPPKYLSRQQLKGDQFMNETIYEINTYLKRQKFITSDHSFSLHYLNRSRKYLSMTKSTDRDIGTECILHLANKLQHQANFIKRHSGPSQIDVAITLEKYSRKLICDLIPLPSNSSIFHGA